MTDQFTPDYGTDLSCTNDIDPMMHVVSGSDMMAQVCVRRLFCRKGMLLSDPLYGIDVRDFLNTKITSTDLTRIQALCRAELMRDERIFSAKVEASYSQDTKTLALSITGTGATGPFALVLSVASGQVTVQVLSPV